MTFTISIWWLQEVGREKGGKFHYGKGFFFFLIIQSCISSVGNWILFLHTITHEHVCVKRIHFVMHAPWLIITIVVYPKHTCTELINSSMWSKDGQIYFFCPISLSHSCSFIVICFHINLETRHLGNGEPPTTVISLWIYDMDSPHDGILFCFNFNCGELARIHWQYINQINN